MLVQSWLVGCFGNASEPNTKTVTTDSKLLRTALPSLQCIYRDRVRSKANTTVSGDRHPLSSSFKVLPSPWCYCPFFPSTKIGLNSLAKTSLRRNENVCLYCMFLCIVCFWIVTCWCMEMSCDFHCNPIYPYINFECKQR